MVDSYPKSQIFFYRLFVSGRFFSNSYLHYRLSQRTTVGLYVEENGLRDHVIFRFIVYRSQF